MSSKTSLVLVQSLPTDCARAAQPFRMNGNLYLAVAQFARNLADEKASMHGGDSDIPLVLYRWEAGHFIEVGNLPAAGGEDAEYFEINGRQFLAVANIRSGSGPYNYDVESVIFEYVEEQWCEFQRVATFGAKQWRYFSIDEQHFLGLAQGVEQPGLTSQHPTTSRIYRWNGEKFTEFQILDGRWGYNWTFVTHGDQHYLAYADHLANSPILKWQDGSFQPLLKMPETGGRAFAFFQEGGELFGVFASISGRTVFGHFIDEGFAVLQELGGAGGRELALLEHDGRRYLARVTFITGSREAPQTVQDSQVFVWEKDRFQELHTFRTFGGTSCAWFIENQEPYLVVTNSLSADVRFRNDTQVYRLSI